MFTLPWGKTAKQRHQAVLDGLQSLATTQKAILMDIQELKNQTARVVAGIGTLNQTVTSDNSTIKSQAETIKDLTDKLAALPPVGDVETDEEKAAVEEVIAQLKGAADSISAASDNTASAVQTVKSDAANLPV